MNGSDVERALARSYAKRGWAVLRAPASGAATDREMPDLLVGWHDHEKRRGERYALEVKASKETTAYIDSEEVDGLRWFGSQLQALPAVAARFKRDTTAYIVPLAECRESRTGSGTLGVPHETAEERAVDTIEARL